MLSHIACFFLSSGIFDGEALYLSFLCTDYILPPFQLKAKGSHFEIIRFFAEKQNVFRHRILDAFQEYPPFQSATKSSFLAMCYFTRCHAHQPNKLQVGRSHPTRSLFWLCFLLAAHGNTRLTAAITGEQCQRVIPRCHFFCCRGGQRFQRCHLIALFLPVHGLQRDLVTGL